MAINLTAQRVEKNELQDQISDRFLQIRRDLYEENNRFMSEQIGEDERVVSSICTKKRAVGLVTILKLLNANPNINANWLLLGRGQMLVSQPQSFNISSSPKATINNGDMKVDMPVGIVELLNSQQETIKKLTSVIENLSHH